MTSGAGTGVPDSAPKYRTVYPGRRPEYLPPGRRTPGTLAAGDGHPTKLVDMSFAIQARFGRGMSWRMRGGKLDKRLYRVPEEIDRRVAWLKLKSLGITIDSLTEEQEAY